MTAVQANGKGTTWDLKAATAASVAEADEEPFAFAYEGGTYAVPPANRWPARVMAMLSDGDLGRALSLLLGEEAWLELCDKGLTLGEVNTLFERIAKQAGFDSVPNSGPPARVSSVPRRSKPR